MNILIAQPISKYVVAAILCSFIFASNAQDYTQSVIGRIIDLDTKKPIVGAKVTVLNTSPLIGALSNEDGYFSIEKLKVGRYDLRVVPVMMMSIISRSG